MIQPRRRPRRLLPVPVPTPVGRRRPPTAAGQLTAPARPRALIRPTHPRAPVLTPPITTTKPVGTVRRTSRRKPIVGRRRQSVRAVPTTGITATVIPATTPGPRPTSATRRDQVAAPVPRPVAAIPTRIPRLPIPARRRLRHTLGPRSFLRAIPMEA